VGHRRHVHSGTVCKGTAGSSCGGAEPAGSGTGVRAGPQDGAEDAGVSSAAWVSAADRRPKLGPWQAAIDAILEEDKSRPRRQRHSAKRIWERLREEHGYAGGYTIVKDYVRESKIGAREMFVPLSHAPGEAQADFGEALVVVAGVECEAHYLAFDLPHSDDCFVVAFPAETTEAFLEGHVRAFTYFGGIPTRILYDNTTLAVARILGDGQRQKTRAFSELQSHYLFAEKFGRPAKGNDKGKVEGLVGYARRNFMVPIPRAASWEELNVHLQAACLKRRQRHLRGHRETIAERFERDRAALLPLPAAPYEACEKITTRVTSLSIQRLLRAYRVRTPAGAGEGLCASVGDRLRKRSHRPAFTPPLTDLRTQKWSDLISGVFANWMTSADRKYLYAATSGSEPKLLRIRFADHHLETITSLKDFRRVMDPITGGTEFSVAPDGSPIFTRDIGSQEVYALKLRWR